MSCLDSKIRAFDSLVAGAAQSTYLDDATKIRWDDMPSCRKLRWAHDVVKDLGIDLPDHENLASQPCVVASLGPVTMWAPRSSNMHVLEAALRVGAALICKSVRRAHVVVLPSTEPRLFPAAGTTIGFRNANGGVNLNPTSKQPCSIILIRLEEMPKVLCHELSHNYVPTTWPEDMVEELKMRLNVDPAMDLRPYEALAEMRAITFLLACLVAMGRTDSVAIWGLERQWAYEQSVRLMTHERLSGLHMWTEKTNTLCYLHLRFLLMDTLPTGFPSNDFRAATDTIMKRAEQFVAWPGPVEGLSLRFTRPGGISEMLLEHW